MAEDFIVKSEGDRRRLVINYKGKSYGPDIAQYPQAFQDVIETLQKVDADEVVLSEYYERIYDVDQTKMLKGIADCVTKFETESIWSPSHLGKELDAKKTAERHDAVLSLLNKCRGDPFGAYMNSLTELKKQVAYANTLAANPAALDDLRVYLNTISFIRTTLESTQLIQKMRQYLAQLGQMPSGRGLYMSMFEVSIKPSFIGSRILFTGVEKMQLVDQYDVVNSKVYIYKQPDKIEYLYYINPPEYSLPPDKYFLLEKTKEVVAAHRPGSVGFMDMEQARKYFRKIYVATIADLATKNNISLSVEEKEDLATIVARYTIGYGILEVLLSDRKITDVYIDSPLGMKTIYIVHGKYGQCQTNIVFSEEEARATVSRFRALSGRPFDEAHPILDFDLPDLQTRICTIGKPLAVDGTAFALRLHKDTPWTLCQFIDFKMFPSIASGIFSFFVDAQASMLIVGSRGAGKTSFLQAMMQEIPQNLRIIVQEDSVTADARMIVERNGILESTTAGQLVDGLFCEYGCEDFCGKQVLRTNPDGVKVFSYDYETGKIVSSSVTQFTRHLVNKPIYEVETHSGRKLKVTADHSLFTFGNSGVEPIKTNSLKKGDFIAVPRRLTFPEPTAPRIFDVLNELNFGFVQGEKLRGWMRANSACVRDAAETLGYHKATAQHWLRCGLLPVKAFNELNPGSEARESLLFKTDAKSKPIPVAFKADEDLATFAGLWLADGCYDTKYGVVISVDDEESRAVVRRIAEKFGLKTRLHSDGISLIISNTSFNWLCKNILKLEGGSYTKKMPAWAWTIGKREKAALLRGLFSGDGNVTKAEVQLSSCSRNLEKETESMLLSFGIFSRTYEIARDNTNRLSVSALKMQKRFQTEIGFLQAYKNSRLQKLCSKSSTHDSTDIIPFHKTTKEWICSQLALNRCDYLTKGFAIGRQKLQAVSSNASAGNQATAVAQLLSNNELYWDEVKEVHHVETAACFVYDFSVPNRENFVAENMIAHNTQELPVPALKKFGFNIQRLKTRPPLGAVSEAEVSAEDALRTALRLGDSVLIVGEVRSGEAKALYEAMRVGAVGNVVMGTIHGESAYSIWDRVVNDLGVPTTSFKATDMCIVSAPIRFKGSLKRERRVLEVTEVGKEWTEEPGKENGFLQWMQFDAGKDNLELFKDNLGNSEWLKRVQRNRGMTFDEIWAEIQARADYKQYLVDQKRKYDISGLLEAENTIHAHNKYMLMAERQREEIGAVEHESLLTDWRAWVDQELVRPLLALKKR